MVKRNGEESSCGGRSIHEIIDHRRARCLLPMPFRRDPRHEHGSRDTRPVGFGKQAGKMQELTTMLQTRTCNFGVLNRSGRL